jgi:hypothetical protein
MTMSLVCTSTNTISKQEHMATPSLNDQPFIDTTDFLIVICRKVVLIQNDLSVVFKRKFGINQSFILNFHLIIRILEL